MSKIVVTRPAHLAEPLMSALQQSGFDPYLFPTINIVPTEQSLFTTQVETIQQAAGWIFVSPNAVLMSEQQLKQITPVANRNVAAIGAGTAACLSKANIPVNVITPPPYNSEHLLAQPILQSVKQQSWIIFSGVGGRETLQETLKMRGATVTMCPVYRRECPKNDCADIKKLIARDEIDVMITTSITGLMHLIQLLPDWINELRKVPLMVISERQRHYALQQGFNPFVAQGPDDISVIDCLKQIDLRGN